MGCIDVEIEQLKGAGSKRKTRKRAFLLKRLHGIFSKSRLDLKRLLAVREKRITFLRVKVLRRQRVATVTARKEVNERMVTLGPNSLLKKSTTQDIPIELVEEIESF